MNVADITLVLGVDARHLEELRWVWPSWMQHKPELRNMPAIVFYDASQVHPGQAGFVDRDLSVRWVPWEMPSARSQREKMLSGFVHIPATEVKTPWYLKLDTDVLATGAGTWLKPQWMQPDERGDNACFVSSAWGYGKPRYLIDLYDDWGDSVVELREFPRLNIPYSSTARRVYHRRIISWFFLGNTEWTRQVAGFIDATQRLPYPSHDTYMFYCAARTKKRMIIERMKRFHWSHGRILSMRKKAPPPASVPVADADASGASKPAARVAQGTHHGVVYYNTGTGCLARLLVSLHSLRRHYRGPVTLLSEGEASHPICFQIGQVMGADVVKWESNVAPGPGKAYVSKTKIPRGTPYRTTVILDADTLVLSPLDDLFQLAETHAFCVARFADWKSSGEIYARRIRQWLDLAPEDIEAAVHFGPAINTGVVAFTKGAEILEPWSELAMKGRHLFIPDEVACQILLHRFKHRVLGSEWNCSCKYDHPEKEGVRIVHFHGRKHCRPGLPFHGDLWMAEFQRLVQQDVAGLRSWMPAGDAMLKRYLRRL